MTQNDTMMTDYYEFTMANTYYNQGLKDTEVVFDIFFRKNPFEGGYTISGGLDNIIDYINNFKFTEEDIEYLRKTKDFSEEFLNYLKNIKFTGDIYAVKDGTVVFPNEPVITVKTNIIEAQLLETALLTHFNHGSLVTTKAKRITSASKGRPVMEFGARRARGSSSACEASKYAVVGGCVGTSNVKAAKEENLKPMGTMAHSLVTLFEDEKKAFYEYAINNRDNCIFLVDTYDTLNSGIPNAIWVADNLLKPLGIEFKGIRIDSGNLVKLSKEARKMLDKAGYPNVKICLSNGLDEYSIENIINKGAIVDSFGIGDNIAASNDRLGGVYKLVAVKENDKYSPRIKVSDDEEKTINPGFKKIYRIYNEKGEAISDIVTMYDEELKLNENNNYKLRELKVPVFINGRQVYEKRSIEERKKYCEEEFRTIKENIKDIHVPETYGVYLSETLSELKKELIDKHTSKKERGKTYAQRKIK